MLFSEHFDIDRGPDDSWFDPVLDHDTKLFIDPFLIAKRGKDVFAAAHQKLIDFFEQVFMLAARSGGNRDSPAYGKALNLLMFPEVEELCLGYAGEGVAGAGTAKGFAKAMAAAVFKSIDLGLVHVKHFEEIGIFNKGISCDRISDITANILKKELVAYTQAVCKRHEVPTAAVKLQNYGLNDQFLSWDEELVDLPINPNSGRGVLLVPEEFLRQLPTISVDGFWDYVWDNKGEELRHDFNFEVKSKVRKEEIIALAQEQRSWVREYVEWLDGWAEAVPYDLKRDPAGLYQWARFSTQFVKQHPLELKAANSEGEFLAVIEQLLDQFKHFVEQTGGYKLLWNDKPLRPKTEEAAQLLFLGIAKQYCKANNIDISREVNIGRGPVDFKFSNGYTQRVLIEVKLAKNSRFWNGLTAQLPTYLSAEEVKHGYFLVICHKTTELRRKLAPINAVVSNVAARTGCSLGTRVVDATRDKASASKL